MNLLTRICCSPSVLDSKAEHRRLWTFIPRGAETLWIDAARPLFQDLIAQHSTGNQTLRGVALDRILLLPSETLLRARGGRRRTTQTIRARLRKRAVALRNGSTAPTRTAPSLSAATSHSADAVWAAKLRRATDFASRGNLKKAIRTLVQPNAIPLTPERVETLRSLHPTQKANETRCPATAPPVLISRSDLYDLVRNMGSCLSPACQAHTAAERSSF